MMQSPQMGGSGKGAPDVPGMMPPMGCSGGKGGFGPMKGMPTGMGGRPGPYELPAGLGPPAETNEKGLPIRPGREQCLVYVNTGSCSNGIACIFDHPRDLKLPAMGKGMSLPNMMPPPGAPPSSGPPTPLGGSMSMPGLGAGLSAASPPALTSGAGSSPVPASGPSSIAGTAPPSMSPPAPALFNPAHEPESSDKLAGVSDSKPLEKLDPAVEYNDDGLPIRPGMQKCGFYLRSGNCRYGQACRYDHPAGLGGLMASGQGFGNMPLLGSGPSTTQGSLPRRPGKDQCPFVKRTGECPFGPECRFDHAPGGGAEIATGRMPQPAVKSRGLGGQKSKRPQVW
mmetsp:Transcript_78693/g.163657  ORF Transcript_78693/g.163657 Transcript_78693/m.163657 type:complete len:340 (+) Transcript_78693:243-1262(+)|eukprot:CAMPEP_0206449294 /NCGR_PEP_ID=MMETSP0324_2-20121206/18002_1 /ASSEMBLY_ACC=CAM_ASM_000836 /TAXON_ID=2866 /ORGANISM="Crypthecodinium cohnii, Strain Seligo" /LENGTH=339 /DNA_ID=CAMNT_0053918641 /DNA_START=41 /DNA_END=1060 /DNA_ORIENTATION=+